MTPDGKMDRVQRQAPPGAGAAARVCFVAGAQRGAGREEKQRVARGPAGDDRCDNGGETAGASVDLTERGE